MKLKTEAVAKRFEQLALEAKAQDRRFRYENQRALGLSRIPAAAPRQARQIAEAQPWTGEESVHDVNLRMLNDAHKPLKLSRSERLATARESAIDYRYNEMEGPTHKERIRHGKSRQINTSGLSGGGWVESIAAQQIEDAYARGQFKDIARGEKAEATVISGATAANPMIDFTEYLLNNIIKKQGGTPPWIAKQLAVRERIDDFRTEIAARLREKLVLDVVERYYGKKNVEEAIQLAYSERKKLLEWEDHYREYHHKSIDDINRAIRGYNLQAPATARRGYLNLDSEIEQCYAAVYNPRLGDAIRKHWGAVDVPSADRNQLHKSLPPLESQEKHYGLRQLLRDAIRGQLPA